MLGRKKGRVYKAWKRHKMSDAPLAIKAVLFGAQLAHEEFIDAGNSCAAALSWIYGSKDRVIDFKTIIASTG